MHGNRLKRKVPGHRCPGTVAAIARRPPFQDARPARIPTSHEDAGPKPPRTRLSPSFVGGTLWERGPLVTAITEACRTLLSPCVGRATAAAPPPGCLAADLSLGAGACALPATFSPSARRRRPTPRSSATS